MTEDEKYMEEAIDLAYKGLGGTYPNPAVGCVIVSQGRVIGRGYHRRAGEPHAEVNAIESVEDRELLSQSTLYVTLEPCAHYGKTPPCADRIVETGIPRVVVGTPDPFAQVNGRGVEKLRKAGVEVVVGVKEAQCRELNKRFFTYHEKKRPFVILKWAQTADGFLDRCRDSSDEPPLKITGGQAQKYVHEMRSIEQAILVGTRAAVLDNPRLDARLAEVKRHPLRIALDRHGDAIPVNYHLKDGSIPTLIFTEAEKTGRENLHYKKIDFSGDVIPQVLSELYTCGIQSLIVEGGAETLRSFLGRGLWDEAYVFTGMEGIGGGVKAPGLPADARLSGKLSFGEDCLYIYKNPLT